MRNGRRWTKRILLVLFAWAAISSAVVLPYAHVHWQDEVQIVEIARGGIVDKPECWSMLASGNSKVDAQAWAIYYVGGWMLERAYQFAGHLGPRCLTMTAFALLAFVFGLYLYKKTGDGVLSAMLALLFWSFPPLQLCARGVRADILALLVASLSLLTLQICVQSNGKRCAVFALAGGLYALSVFTWISAALLAPVVLWEMCDRLISEKHSVKSWIVSLGSAGVAAVAVVLAILLPFLIRWNETVEVSKIIWSINTNVSVKAGHWLWKELAICLAQPPGLYVFGGLLLFTRRRFFLLAVGFVGFLFVCLVTKVYSTRLVYFLPYVLIASALGISMMKSCRWRRGLYVVVGLMVLLAYGRTYVIRNLTDFRCRHYRDCALMRPIVEKSIGRDLSVYADTFQLYYIGRELGWKQYHYIVQWLLPSTDLLKKVDCVVTDADAEKKGMRDLLVSNGFAFAERLEMPLEPETWLSRSFSMPTKSGPFIGPFNVYRRALAKGGNQ